MILCETVGFQRRSKTLLHCYSGGFEPGSVMGLLGHNGSGKTSFLKILAGLDTDYEGRVYIKGKNLRNCSLKELAALRVYVPAVPICYWPLSTQELLAIENPLFDLHHPVLQLLHLKEFLKHHFLNLSSGERARVFLAHALMRKKPLLILDEITSHLDDAYQRLVMKLLKNYAEQEGTTIVLSMHQKELAYQFCDHVVELKGANTGIVNKPIDFKKGA